MSVSAKIETTIEVITPAIAKNWLTRNLHNREKRPAHINDMAAAMRRGDFPLTHQGIAFDTNGILLDGQNRLEAVIKADMAVTMMVTRGMPRSTFAYLDQGAKRNCADTMEVDKKTAEVINLLTRLLTSSMKPSPSQLAAVKAHIYPVCLDLSAACAGSSKVFSCSSMRLAAITAVLMGEDKRYVFDTYRALVNASLKELPPIAQSFTSQVLREAVNAQNKHDMLARGMKVFRKANAGVSKLQVMDSGVEVDAVRAFYRARIRGL